MCGITGFVSYPGQENENKVDVINKMTSKLFHRGPDDSGTWIDDSNNIALGHRRLSIIDLSSAGHQPMLSSCKRFVLVFNGEIYNHLALRNEINKSNKFSNSWLGSSDTETLLRCFEIWGFEKTLSKLVGMFSICLFDKELKALHLARDRIGEKPLYYGHINNSFVFSSELKALKEYPNFNNKIDRDALKKYFQFLYIPAPKTIYQNIFKLKPGYYLSIPLDKIHNLKDIKKYINSYWNLGDHIIQSNNIKEDGEYLNELETHLENAIDSQSIADVPLGAFLSGGIDSSLITALMQKNTTTPVKTFTIGFEEISFDESPYAKKVAEYLGTDHSELFVTSKETRDVIPNLPYIYDEPFADSSQIPTFLVCAAARSKVTVALSGDAGDELFGGYNRYFWGPRIWQKFSWMPFFVRKIIGNSMDLVPSYGLNYLEKNMHKYSKKNITKIGNKFDKISKVLKSSRNVDDMYSSLTSEWDITSSVVIDDSDTSHDYILEKTNFKACQNDSLNMMYKDILSYLPDDILCKVDRAAMASSLETRAPFLDHRVVEFALGMPIELKIRNNKGKWALREILYKYVPKDMMERPKTGFSIPIGDWLRGPLKEWAEELLDNDKIKSQGYLKPEIVSSIWTLHKSGKYDYTSRIWSILMFQSWLESNS